VEPRGGKLNSRGLRFTLSTAYTAVFTLLLIGVSLIYRHNLVASLDSQVNDDLNTNWTIVKGNLRIYPDYKLDWFLDPNDPEENSIKAEVRRVDFIADSDGHILEENPANSVAAESVGQIRRALQSNQAIFLERTLRGVPYRIRESWVWDEAHSRRFFVSIGTSLAGSRAILNQFTWLCVGLIPLVILAGYLTGWIFAGRALTPVLEIARAAQRISGSNLSLRLPSRKAGDELDYLIETFNQMIERIEINFNQVRQFSTDVSHELRTPITVVRGQLEVALFTAQTADQYRDAIVNSLADIERLSQIVRALLLLSQAETGQVVLQKQYLDLVELADETADQFQIPAEGAEIELKFIPKVARCEGEFDRIQIERMLSNLLSNAIKFTPPGGRIQVVVERDGDEAEIRIEDTGQGIPAEHLPHIFDRFYRVRGPSDHASPEKGLGLGLSFVMWIARAHGGTVDVQSEPGKGTTFRIRLPLTGAPPQHAAVDAPGELMKPV